MSSRQPSLFASGPVTVRPSTPFERVALGDGAWVDVARDWLGGADELCDRLIAGVAWAQRRRRMYTRTVDEPRLTAWYRSGRLLPDPVLGAFRAEMTARYGGMLGRDVHFGAVGLNHYRSGDDSVAWHADRELRQLDDTLVAILTLGATRPFLLRPVGGGHSIDLRPASGDVMVMGGRAQACFEHAVPKVASVTGPRVSASIRWVRPVPGLPADRAGGHLRPVPGLPADSGGGHPPRGGGGGR